MGTFRTAPSCPRRCLRAVRGGGATRQRARRAATCWRRVGNAFMMKSSAGAWRALTACTLTLCVVVFALYTAAPDPRAGAAPRREATAEWRVDANAAAQCPGVQRVAGAALAQWAAGDAPAVLELGDEGTRNARLRAMTRRERLLRERGQAEVKLASSDTYSSQSVRNARRGLCSAAESLSYGNAYGVPRRRTAT